MYFLLGSFRFNLHFEKNLSISDTSLNSVTFLVFWPLICVCSFHVLSHVSSCFEMVVYNSSIWWGYFPDTFYYQDVILCLFCFFPPLTISWIDSHHFLLLWFRVAFLTERPLLLLLGTLQKCGICFLRLLKLLLIFSLCCCS